MMDKPLKITLSVEQHNGCIEEARSQGRREVVEWIESQRVAGFSLIEGVGVGVALSDIKLRTKLKEWGIYGEPKPTTKYTIGTDNGE